MNKQLLQLFASYMKKQEILSKLTESKDLHGYNYSEIHTITAIGNLDEPNVTNIAHTMHMTRGAISKITKKLLKDDLIDSFKKEGNNQKIYFKLTSKGQELYKEHEKRHNLWLKRDNEFLSKYDKCELDKLEKFMIDFNDYLEKQIKELGGNDEC